MSSYPPAGRQRLPAGRVLDLNTLARVEAAEDLPFAGEVRRQRQRWSEAQKRQIVAETIGTKVVPADLRKRRRRRTDGTHGRRRPLPPLVGVG